ncbi:putative ABC transporter [Hyperthermus butylicus DSM 5456]|uniref:ABC transporter n=2 Tax=Hyperthermus butylicus TaxID=54248 RepID=A2BMN0_HYPBU|nr:putative ABC transporter [Hyperthermus butylicus DSM 5456]
MPSVNRSPLVSMRDIVKIYPDGTVALRGVSIDVYPGEILGLLGENGAGKTTLMKILAGFLKPTRGEIYLRGRRVVFHSAADALRNGIGMVHQHLALVPVFTAYENIVLGLGGQELSNAREHIEKLMEETGLRVRLDVPVEQLSFGERQRIEILRMLYRRVDVLILDEPTTNLTPIETRILFQALKRLRDSGKSVVFITHKLREVLEIADRIVVMRRGRVVGEVPREKAEPKMLARMMVGREVFLRIEKPPSKLGDVVLRVEDLWVRGDTGSWAVKGVSFEVRAGEIFGIAGVEGNGQSELVQALTGLRRVEKGRIILLGRDVTNMEPSELYKLGLAHIPEDRQAMGLILDMSVAENSVLGMHRWPRFTRRLGVISWKAVTEHAKKIIEEYDVVAPGFRSPVRYLSGGNQQKLLVGRELSKQPKLVIAAQPTRGLDVAATEYIRRLLVKLRSMGHAVLLVSADTDEVLQLSDRVAVMYAGRFTAIARPEELTEEKLGLLMGGMEVVKAGQ